MAFVIRKVVMEEAGLLEKLGINWKLLISQAVNFFILLIILRAFVYKPLLSAIKKRNEKIKEGLEKAEEADIRLKEIDIIAKDKIKEAEGISVNLIKNTDIKAKEIERAVMKQAEKRREEMSREIEAERKRQKEESEKVIFSQAADLVRKIVLKTVQIKPEEIDKALVARAVSQIKNVKD